MTSLQAQDTPFIQSIGTDQIPESPEMDAYRERLRKNPNITVYHFIQLNPLASSQKDGILLLDIPDGPAITAVASHVEYESPNEYEWIGKTDDDRGTVIIVAKAGRASAHISTPAGVYEIFPAPAGLHCLQEIDKEKAWDVGCAVTSVRPNPISQEATIEYSLLEDSSVKLDVLTSNGAVYMTLIDHKIEKIKGNYISKWPVSHIPDGIYLIRLRTLYQTTIERILIQR
jgi:hypothetical protein